MGVLYTVVPLDDEIAGYLRDSGGTVPTAAEPARNPTPREISAVCDALRGQRVHYNVNPGSFWQAVVEGVTGSEREPWTLLNISTFSGSEDEPHPIWFEKGWPLLILDILQRLSVRCGPLVVIPDTGEAPIAVTAQDSVEDLSSRWEHTRPVSDSGNTAAG
jgi:hypothetical protein